MTQDITTIELGNEEIPAGPPYDFITNFNRVQSTVIMNGLPMTDCNLVLGTKTSTGKTITSELFIHALFMDCARKKKHKKVVYVAPMKSLVREKYEEWQRNFAGKQISILTGDYRPTPESREKLKQADIVVVTSEMLDSQTRSAAKARLLGEPHWIFDVGLLIMDEAHIIGSGSRGPAAEAGITRMCLIPGIEKPRIVLLSATLPNSEEFATWLWKLNNKKTYILNSDWRPVPLYWHFSPAKGNFYTQKRRHQYELVKGLIKKEPKSKFLVFVHEKKTGHTLVQELKKAGVDTDFHRADLAKDKRISLENRFKDNDSDLNVLISTSTLAWGCNLPARNVIIVGTNRGIQPVDLADIIQMAGRGGRAGLDSEGHCYLLVDDPYVEKWKKLVEKSPPVESALLDPAHLRFQVLAEISLGIIDNLDDIEYWFDKTLIGQQGEYDSEHFNETISQLASMGMAILNDQEELEVTRLGQVSTRFYFTPDDVHHWNTYLSKVHVADTDAKVATLIGGAPTISVEYIPKEHAGTVGMYLRECQKEGVAQYAPSPEKHFMPYCLLEHLRGDARDKGLFFYIQNLITDIDRVITALRALCELDEQYVVPPDVLVRIKNGIPKQLAFLVGIPGIGPKKAFLMYTAGITEPEKLRQTELSTLITCLGATTAKKVMSYIENL